MRRGCTCALRRPPLAAMHPGVHNGSLVGRGDSATQGPVCMLPANLSISPTIRVALLDTDHAR